MLPALLAAVLVLLGSMQAPVWAGQTIMLPHMPAESAAGSFDPVLDPDAVSVPPASARVLVNDAGELNRALAAAAPGQLIELADGTYDAGAVFTVRGVRGTKSAPLIIRAQNPGRAIIAGGSWFLVENSSYVVIEGFSFITVDKTNNFAVRLRGTNHSRVTRNRFALVESPTNLSSRHWVYIDGTGADYNRIDHNYFEGKRRIGNFVSVNGDDVQVGQYNRIDRNHFKDARSVNSNGMEAIRIGTSGVARSYAYAIVEYNLFEQCNGDAETITVKSGGNQIRYNTFWECEGTMTLRHGNDNKVYGNYFLGNNKPLTGGVRVYGRGHEVYNNYFAGLEGTGLRAALTIGSADVENQEVVLNYWRVERLLVAFNTFVNNRSSIAIAPDASQPFAPISTVIANNLVVSDKPGPLVSVGKPAEIAWRGNVMHAAGSASVGVNLQPAELRNADPQLILGVDGVHYVGARSPVIDAAQPILSSPVIGTDIEGKPRDTHPDVGAFEYAGYPLLRGPLTAAEVGPDAPPATAFSLSAPAVHITKLELQGIFHEKTGWWGPLVPSVEALTTGAAGAAGAAVAYTVLVDGAEVYRGAAGHLAELRLNRGELADGWHVLTVAAESGEYRDTKTLRFQVANVRFQTPANAATVQGRLPVEVAVGLPPDELRSVQVILDDEPLYSGAVAPVGLAIDTLRLAERWYRLQAVATSVAGVKSESYVQFTVDNFWELSDALQAPVDWGFFGIGVMERSQATAKSAGWQHRTERPQDFYDDPDRMTPQGNAAEFLVWATPRLTRAVVTIFARDDAVGGQVDCAVSADGSAWRSVEYQVNVAGRSEQGWLKLELVAVVPDPVNHFRLTVKRSEATPVEEALQVGQVMLYGWHER